MDVLSHPDAHLGGGTSIKKQTRKHNGFYTVSKGQDTLHLPHFTVGVPQIKK